MGKSLFFANVQHNGKQKVPYSVIGCCETIGGAQIKNLFTETQ